MRRNRRVLLRFARGDQFCARARAGERGARWRASPAIGRGKAATSGVRRATVVCLVARRITLAARPSPVRPLRVPEYQLFAARRSCDVWNASALTEMLGIDSSSHKRQCGPRAGHRAAG